MRFTFGLTVAAVAFLSALDVHAYNPSSYEQVLSFVRTRDLDGLQEFVADGNNVDAQSVHGDTALCQTILYRDYQGFELLTTQGADVNHPCTQKISTYNRRHFMRLKPQAGTFYTGTFMDAEAVNGGGTKTSILGDTAEYGLWAAGIAGGVALLSSLDGGGSSSGSGSGGGGGSGGELPDVAPPNIDIDEPEFEAGRFLDMIGAQAAYNRGYTGYKFTEDGQKTDEKIRVGMVDSGVWIHDDLKDNLLPGFNYDYGPCRSGDTTSCWVYDEIAHLAIRYSAKQYPELRIEMTPEQWNAYSSPYPDDYDWDERKNEVTPFEGSAGYYHGTLVAGTIAAASNGTGIQGVAPNAAIIPVRYDLKGYYDKAVNDLITNGARVINFSLGIDPGNDESLRANTVVENPNSRFEEAMGDDINAFKYAVASNTVLVFAAGNDGHAEPGIDKAAPLSEALKASLTAKYNKTLENLFITVVSLGPDKTIADYSTRCGSTAGYCLAAPGGGIYDGEGVVSTSYGGGYSEWRGTSAAAPVVTGSVALLMGAFPHLTSQEVVSLLFETADDLGEEGVDAVYGNGLINLDRASQPVKEQKLATGDDVTQGGLSAAHAKITLPATYAEKVLGALPENVAIMDKYKRFFAVPTSSFIRTAHHNPDIFRNALHRFTQHDAEGKLELSPRLSFSFNKAASIDADSGIGSVDMMYRLSPSNDMHVFFVEDGKYGRGAFFDRVLVNPFSAMDNAYGFENVYKLSSRSHIKMGFSTGENGLIEGNDDLDLIDKKQSYAFNTSMDYKLTDNSTVGFVGGILREERSVLGLYGTGGFETPDTDTYFMGLTGSFKPIDKLTLQAAYYYGISNPQGGSAFMRTGQLISDSFALDARYQLNEKDVAGIQFSSPLRIRKGAAEFDLPVGRDMYSNAVYREKVKASLKPEAREYDLAVYYTKSISDALRVKSQAGLRLNPEHQDNVAPDYNMLFSLDWKY